MDAIVMSPHHDFAGEMSFKTRPASIFSAPPSRPQSTATDILDDSDWEDEDAAADSGSDFEEDDEGESPRGSFDTLASIDEAPTPRLSGNDAFIRIRHTPSTSGPVGPHLFRTSFDEASKGFGVDGALQMSPLLPKDLIALDLIVNSPDTLTSPWHRDLMPEEGKIYPSLVRNWSVDQVAAWMVSAGFDHSIIEKFERHEITGAVLLDLTIDQLKELDIPTFGQRHKVWTALSVLREDGVTSPAGTTFEDLSRPTTRNTIKPIPRDRSKVGPGNDCGSETPIEPSTSRRIKVRRNNRSAFDDVLTPAESISIVAIEQLMPKPHKCPKGEDCPKWKKQERLRKQIEKEHAISPDGGGEIWIAGYFDSSPRVDNVENGLRDSEPSVVASSDLLGGAAQTPAFNMDKEMKRQLERHEAQNSVQQYLTLQHVARHARTGSSADAPPSPPLETPYFNNIREGITTPRFAPPERAATHPPPAAPHSSLKQLPKLTIPRSATAGPRTAMSPQTVAFSPIQRLRSPAGSVFRVGTPASLNDLPMTAINMTPIAREQSHSVPPNMVFRPQTKHRGSKDPRTWQRASFKLPGIPENGSTCPISPIRSPIRVSSRVLYGAGTTHVGHMRKRKTRLLRHEWSEHHFRLKGSQLAMHATARPDDRKALNTINIDDFTVACSSVSSDSKLATALKMLRITSEKKGKKEAGMDDAAFVFQLIPVNERTRVLNLLKDMKTHHFAVKTRDQRIDWMREVMIAKAKKHKDLGYEVTMNGQHV